MAVLLLAVGSCHAAMPTQEVVMARATILYADRLRDYPLDADQRFAARVQAIAAVLIAQAKRDYPETVNWAWEIHTTDDEHQNADCMAGGKILVSKAYVDRLALSDAELAMLLAHEIEHAALYHNLKEYQLAIRVHPAWAERPFIELEDAVENDHRLIAELADLNYAQEREADVEGLKLAWRAGWPAQRLAGYFHKIMLGDGWLPISRSDRLSPSQRWRMAKELAATLQKNQVQQGD